MAFLLRATGPALVSWPVFVLVVVWSSLLGLVGSGAAVTGGLPLRAGIAALGGVAACVVAWLAWRLVLSRFDGMPRVVGGVLTVIGAGLARGLLVQAAFAAVGFADGSIDGVFVRAIPSLFTMPFAFLVGAAAVAAVQAYRTTSALLLSEQRRLVRLMEVSASGMHDQQSATLDRVRRRLDEELRDLALDTTPAAIASLESLTGDIVRPLSHTLARDLPMWDPTLPDEAPRVRWIDVLREPDASAAIHPIALPVAFSVIALPGALVLYQPGNGLLTVLAGLTALGCTLGLGRLWLTRYPPRSAASTWLAIGLILGAGALAASAAARLGEMGDPSAGTMPALALFVVPVFGLIIAVVSMMGARMRQATADLEATTRQLKCRLARVNTQQWEQRGRLSRALHGPVQSLIQAHLLRLRRQLEAGVMTSAELDELRVDLQRALASGLASPSAPRPVGDVLDDVAQTWEGLATVSYRLAPVAEALLSADPLCTQAIADLATEAVSNAVRHGRATAVDVDIDLDADDLIRLSVVDDGRVSEAGLPGLGTALLAGCTYDWSLTHGPTTLTARLPCGIAGSGTQEAPGLRNEAVTPRRGLALDEGAGNS